VIKSVKAIPIKGNGELLFLGRPSLKVSFGTPQRNKMAPEFSCGKAVATNASISRRATGRTPQLSRNETREDSCENISIVSSHDSCG
jgi:hypothetical protein